MADSPSVARDSVALVTGVTGFVGAHIALNLLKRGYKVKGSARSQDKFERLARLPHFEAFCKAGRFTFVELKDLVEGDYDNAVKACDLVFHVASPFHYNELKEGEAEHAFLKPALEGVRRVFEASLRAGVKHLIMTSSDAAVFEADDVWTNRKTYTEVDWNSSTYEEGCKSTDPGFVYVVSKAAAERELHRLAKEAASHSTMKVTAICMPWVFGPYVHDVTSLKSLNLSNEWLWQYVVKAAPGSEVPEDNNPTYVDVRDAAEAHVLAAEKGAEGRILLCSGYWCPRKILDVMLDSGDETLRQCALKRLGQTEAQSKPESWQEKDPRCQQYDTTLSRKLLGINYTPSEQTFIDCARQFLQLD